MELEPHSVPNAPNDECEGLVRNKDSSTGQFYFGNNQVDPDKDMTGTISDFLLKLSARRGPHREFLENVASREPERFISSSDAMKIGAEQILVTEKRAQAAYRSNKDKFPTSIWHCCRKLCFTSIAIDSEKVLIFEALVEVHGIAEKLYASIRQANLQIQTRRRGIGGSSIALNAP